MGLSVLIAIICIVIAAIALVWACDEYSEFKPVAWVVIFGCLLGLYSCATSEDMRKKRADDELERQTCDEQARIPKLAAAKDGVNLYYFKDSCYGKPIYFSKSGAQWEECVSSGKSTKCEQIYVPNAETKP